MMLLFLGIVAYSCAAVGTWRAMTGHFAWDMLERKRKEWKAKGNYYQEELDAHKAPSGETWFGALCLGFVVALLWPLALMFTRAPFRELGQRRKRKDAK